MSEIQALTNAAKNEYATTFAYGVISAFAMDYRGQMIGEYTAAHRALRDSAIAFLRSSDSQVPIPDPAYVMPFDVVDPVSAAQLGAQIESDSATVWRSVVEHANAPEVRRLSVEALTACAIRAATWQQILELPAGSAFPGAQ